MKKLGQIFSTIFLLFAIVVVVYVVYKVIDSRRTGEEVFILGYKPYIILTGSMEPTIRQYGLVIVEKDGFNNVQVGDIISFDEPGVLRHVCHRVIAIENGVLTTKGDNNNSQDLGTVSESNFIGKVVWHNNFTAYYYNSYQSPYGVWKVVVLPIVVIILIIVGVHLLRKRDRKDRSSRRKIDVGANGIRPDTNGDLQKEEQAEITETNVEAKEEAAETSERPGEATETNEDKIIESAIRNRRSDRKSKGKGKHAE